MLKITASLPNCWILDRATLKWQRKTYTIVGVMDLASRKLLRWNVFRPLKADAVARMLDQTVEQYGKPPALVVGIDPVFQSPEVALAYLNHDCLPVDLRQGKSSVTIFTRSLWRNLSGEGLSWANPPNEETFQQTIDDWLNYYNGKRPHQALGYQTPDQRWRGMTYPHCLDGERHCPPEDCGGIWGYEELLTVLNDKRHPERTETLQWLGGRFKPESFAVDKINRQLGKLLKR